MPTPTYEPLRTMLEICSASLPGVRPKKMFGCDAFFAGNQIFALVWKTGRIGVKLPDAAAFTEIMSMPGSAPWSIGKMSMSQWVLVPERMHTDREALTPVLAFAHAAAQKGAAKKKIAPKKKIAKKK
jgi:hypothetical protein